MQQIAKRLIRMVAMYLVGALNAQIQWWRTIGRMRNADGMIVAHLGRFCIARIRTRLALADKRN